MADQTFYSGLQKHYIDPWNQRVFQFNSDRSDVFLSRVANSVFHVFGNDIVMSGMIIQGVAFDPDSATITISPGDILQDNTLIQIPEQIELKIDGLSGLDEDGRVVVFSNFRYLETFEKNDQHFQINYINSASEPLFAFDHSRDRLLLGIFQFAKDGSDNVTAFVESNQTSIFIDGKFYYLKGFTPENRKLTQYLIHQLFTADLSIVLDPVYGLKLRNDEASPGVAKYYGTGPNGDKGFFDISSLAFDNLSDIEGYTDVYNQVIYNGNLFFLAPGHTVDEFFVPIVPLDWIAVFDESFWDPGTGVAFDGETSKWMKIEGVPMSLTPADGSYWAEGFRPTKIRITGVVASGVDNGVELRHSTGIIAQGSAETTLELNCDFTIPGDIITLILNDYSEISNIEFLGGTMGVAPPS